MNGDPRRPPDEGRERLFLLSPASLAGVRGRRILAGEATGRGLLAGRLAGGGAVPLSEVYSSISSLYFRGKLAYARRFHRRPDGRAGVLVITPNLGLVPSDHPVRLTDLASLAGTDIDLSERAYVDPLTRTARVLAAELSHAADVVLLGSIATTKYVEPLSTVFPALRVPKSFVGRGDMSRGGIMLRAVEAGEELDYVRVSGTSRRGSRPAKLGPA